MKKIISLIVVVLLSGLALQAQNYTLQIAGYVYQVENNNMVPVPNHEVTISIDSTSTGWYYANTVLTDEYGYYEDVVVPPPGVAYGFITTMTFDSCTGNYLYNLQLFSPGATLVNMDFFLCETATTCQAMFYYYSSPADPYAYNFVNISSGNYTDVLWDFGDSITSTDDNPVHIFAGPGLYTVCLTISGPDDCNSSYCEQIYVGNNGWGCENYFFWYPTDPAGTTIAFEGFLMNGQQALSYDWDFGDGTTGSGQAVTHIYEIGPNGNAIFMVSLTTTVPDSNGTVCTYTSWQEVWLYPQPECFAYFYYYPDNANVLTINFQDMSYTANGNMPDSWFWDFGDGNTSTLQNPVHTYADSGYYFVCLTITDSMGSCTNIYCEEVFTGIFPPPNGCSNYFYYEQTDSTTFTFTGMAYLNNGTTTDDVDYYWDFGDGTTGTGQTITHSFQQNPGGVYTVCLNTIMMLPDGDSCFATFCQDVWTVQPTFSVFGYVYLENNQLADYADIYLKTMDTLWQNVVEVATTTLDSSGFYSFGNVPMYNSRIYYVLAELSEASAFYGEYLPTYHLSALNWESATPILPLMNWTFDVYMIAGTTLNAGNGSITGTVANLGARGAMADVEVVLMDSQMIPYYYVRSDEQGNFSFTGIPYGTYMIHAEIMGIHTNQATVTLTEGQPDAGVEIQVSGGEANVVFGVNEHKISIEKAGNVYPNPVNDNSRIEISLKEPTQVEFSIYNQVGQLAVAKGELFSSGNQSVMINTKGLQPGLYLLRITTANGDLVTRRFVKAQ